MMKMTGLKNGQKVTAKHVCRQGEITIVRLDGLPEKLRRLLPEIRDPREVVNGGRAVVGHSETGHHHVVDSPDVRFLETANPLVASLQLGAEARLQHLRDHHTHGFWDLPAGNYLVTRQREHSPEGWRRVAD